METSYDTFLITNLSRLHVAVIKCSISRWVTLKRLEFVASLSHISLKILGFLLHADKFDYYSFKIFPRFGLVETTRIIHHNQLLFTKFGKNLRHIQSMTSKVEPAAYYSTVDVKMTSKVEPAADYSTVDRKNLGTRL